jgi:tetratricopeptide (TPR) repeat protein
MAISSKILGNPMEVLWATMEEAFEYYVSAGDTANALYVVNNVPPPAYRLLGHSRMTRRFLEIVLTGTVDEARVQLRHGSILSIGEGNLEQGKPHTDRAMELAQSIDDPELNRLVRQSLVTIDTHYLDYQKSAATADEFIALWTGIDGAELSPGSMQFAALSLKALGDVSGAKIISTLGFEQARKTNHQQFLMICLRGLTDCSSLIGDWEEAKQLVEQVTRLRSDTYSDNYSAARNLFIEAFSGGRAELVDRYVNELVFDDPDGEFYLVRARDAARAALAGRMLDRPELLDLAASHAVEAVKAVPPLTPLTLQIYEISMALASVSRDDADGAKDHYESLGITAGQMIAGDFISGDRLLALLAMTLGESEIAEDHFKAAIEFCARVGYRPELAWTKFDFAQMLQKRNDPGDHDRVIELQDEAIAIATELSMKPLLERVLAQREILKA